MELKEVMYKGEIKALVLLGVDEVPFFKEIFEEINIAIDILEECHEKKEIKLMVGR